MWKSAAGMALDKAPLSMRPSVFKSPKSMGNYSILGLFYNGEFVDSRRNLVTPSGVTVSCG